MVVVVLATFVAGATDMMRFKVHNLLTYPLLVSGLIYHAAVGGPQGFAASALGASLGFGFLFVFYLMGGMGGGDVKLLAAIGAWMGLQGTFYLFIVSSLAARRYSLGLMGFNRPTKTERC